MSAVANGAAGAATAALVGNRIHHVLKSNADDSQKATTGVLNREVKYKGTDIRFMPQCETLNERNKALKFLQ